MGERTGISWTGSTWNYIRGCSREMADGAETSGCGDQTGGQCYAERDGGRFCGPGGAYEGLVRLTANGPRWTGRVDVIAHKLLDPLRWQRPRKIFVASVSDPFHPRCSNELIAAAFGVMAIARRHTFQSLTKRAKRMRAWFGWVADAARDAGMSIVRFCVERLREIVAQLVPEESKQLERAIAKLPPAALADDDAATTMSWPLPNLWLGVSTEHQPAYDERWHQLARCPAAVRFVSVEPMIGPVTLGKRRSVPCAIGEGCDCDGRHYLDPVPDWVIIGCESGPRARDLRIEWVDDLVRECKDAGSKVWLKQLRPAGEPAAPGEPAPVGMAENSGVKPGGVIERPTLRGRQILEFPTCGG